MSKTIRLASWAGAGAPRANVVFVHGLGGHAYGTWRRGAEEAGFWPLWLAEDVPGLTVYTLAYEAAATNWLGTAMPLQDRAVNLREGLLAVPALLEAPLVFICHSLGGLIVKQILLDLARQRAALLEHVAGVVFLATPHGGSRQATLLDRLRLFAWPSAATQGLAANDAALRTINVAYRGLAEERRKTLRHLTFYEMRATAAGMIVDEGSADAGLSGRPPVPIDADHVAIAKPVDRDSLVYALTRAFVAEIGEAPGSPGGSQVLPRPAIDLDRSWNLAPRIVRVALVGCVLLIGFKGVQALIAPVPQLTAAQVEEIVKRNVAGSGQPDRPGQLQAAAGAVTATAEAAAAGDKRQQQALDLLKAGKTSEATDLLAALAADKEAQAKQNSKQAAAAYRNLGAIAGLKDPKRAFDAYAKAVALDPEDVESLLPLAYLEEQRGDLAAADGHYRQLLALSATEERAWARYWAFSGIGDIQRQRGKLPEALRSYRDGLAIAARLAQSDPGNAGWQRDLSVSDEKIGNVLVAQGNLPEALRSYRDGLAIRARLAQSDPGNAGWQRDLSVSYAKMATVMGKAGDVAGAAEALRQGRAIMHRMTSLSPDNAVWKRDLAWFDAELRRPDLPR